jgi:predicted amidohydrolase
MISKYYALAIQPLVKPVSKRAEIKANIKRCIDLIDFGVLWFSTESGYGIDVKIICLPEFHAQGLNPQLQTVRQKLGATIEIPGQETELYSKCAKQNDIFIVAAAMEHDEDWPGRIFNTAFIIDPKGTVILKYRKWAAGNDQVEISCSPCDVLDRYMEIYGKGKTVSQTLFPVVQTEIGRLGCMICYDGYFPEVARSLALNGAEVIFRPTASRVAGIRSVDWWEVTNRARAQENMVYLVSATWGFSENSPMAFTPGYSQIIDFNGFVIGEANAGENLVGAMIDLDALWARREGQGYNFLAELRTESFVDNYRREIYPPNQFLHKECTNIGQCWEIQTKAMKKLYKDICNKNIKPYKPKVPMGSKVVG